MTPEREVEELVLSMARHIARVNDENRELLNEVKVLENALTLAVHRKRLLIDKIWDLTEANVRLSLENGRLLARLEVEDGLRAQLAEWERLRTMGGPARGYTPGWTAVA